MKPIKSLLKFSLALAALCGFTHAARADVILHAFEWRYDLITARAATIQAAGYKAVLVAPPLKSSATNGNWWMRYQPQDWRVIDNYRGNKVQFKAMVDALSARGIAVYADVVLNQMAEERSNSTTFPGQNALSTYASNATYWNNQKLFGDLSKELFTSSNFHDALCITNWTDTYQVTHGRISCSSTDPGLPDLKDTVPGENYVNDRRTDYLRALKALGVKGFRIDAAKHMPIGAISYFFADDVRKDSFIFGEIITGGGAGNADYDTFLAPYLSQLPQQFRAYDFPLLNTVLKAFASDGSLSALAQPNSNGKALADARAVSVVVTHDIPYNDVFRHQIMNQTDEQLAYAYILGRKDGVPMVFDDGYEGKTDNGRWVGQYIASPIKAGIRFHEKVLGQPYEVLASNDCALLFRRGQEGVVGINKCGYTVNFTVSTSEKFYWNRNYRDTITNSNVIKISGSPFQFSLPARTARMWLPE